MNSHQLHLPGIQPELLAAAQIQWVDADYAHACCGLRAPGILIPYLNPAGGPVMDQGRPFYRLRLDHPTADGKRYHQMAETKCHAYVPPIAAEAVSRSSMIVIIEGEKKALCLANVDGIMPVGIGGFYSFRQQPGELATELASVLSNAPPEAGVVYYGDRDVIFNYQFSQAAAELASLIAPRSLYVTCPPMSAPGKGVDDWRAASPTDFLGGFARTLVDSIGVIMNESPAVIATKLLKLKLQGWQCPESQRLSVQTQFSELVASLHSFPVQEAEVIDLAVTTTGAGRAVIKRMAKLARTESKIASQETQSNGRPVIDLRAQPGVWARQILEQIGQRTYVFGGSLCVLEETKFRPLNPAALVSLVDSPGCCSFKKAGYESDSPRCNLSERETRIVINALPQNADCLRPVEVLSPTPLLVSTPTEPLLLSGYCKERRILASGEPMGFFEPGQAANHLLNLLRDFQFATAEDKARAIAMLLTPALARGGFLDSGRAPLFFIEKDTKGAGGGYMAKVLAALYGERLVSITPSDPKGAKEDMSKHLLQGSTLVCLDNIRGKILTQLPFFESLLTEPDFTCRAPYVHVPVSVTRCVFLVTSNGAVLSPDLADRTIKIAIRKQPSGYRYNDWPGDLLDHVTAFHPSYLCSIFTLIRDWAMRGRPQGSHVSGFRFSQWEKACTWILENHFGGLRLLDEQHTYSQQRLANPHFDLLRAAFRTTIDRGITDLISTTELTRLAFESNHIPDDSQGSILEMGRALSKEFRAEGTFTFAEFIVRRIDSKDPKGETHKKYSVTNAQIPQPQLQ